MKANMLSLHSPTTPWGGVKRSFSFSKSGHVAYEIKADDADSNMVANIHTRPWGWGQKVKLYLFLKVVMLHIKLKGIEHRAP